VALAKTPNHNSITLSEQVYQPIIPCTKCFWQQLSLTSTYSTITEDNNRNLSPAQKELLLWHCRLGHLSFQHLQWLMRPQEMNS
jgi:hypothetical protein